MEWIIAIQLSNLPQASTAISLVLHLTEMPQTYLFKSGLSFKTQFKCHLLHQTLLVMGQVWRILFSQYLNLYSSNIVYYTQYNITVTCLCDITYKSLSTLKKGLWTIYLFFYYGHHPMLLAQQTISLYCIKKGIHTHMCIHVTMSGGCICIKEEI